DGEGAFPAGGELLIVGQAGAADAVVGDVIAVEGAIEGPLLGSDAARRVEEVDLRVDATAGRGGDADLVAVVVGVVGGFEVLADQTGGIDGRRPGGDGGGGDGVGGAGGGVLVAEVADGDAELVGGQGGEAADAER